MWPDEHRETYRRAGPSFPSNLTDAERGVLAPLIPDAPPVGGTVIAGTEADSYAGGLLLNTAPGVTGSYVEDLGD